MENDIQEDASSDIKIKSLLYFMGVLFIIFFFTLIAVYSLKEEKIKMNFKPKISLVPPSSDTYQDFSDTKLEIQRKNNLLGDPSKSYYQCNSGDRLCVINKITGVKRCPKNNETYLNYDSSFEACVSREACELENLPYAMFSDGRSGPGNICEQNTICSCNNRVTCSRYILSTFEIQNGNAFSDKASLNGYMVNMNTINKKDNIGYTSLNISNDGNKLCQINPAFTHKIKNGCLLNNGLGDKTDCDNNFDWFTSKPLNLEVIDVYTGRKDNATFKQERNLFGLKQEFYKANTWLANDPKENDQMKSNSEIDGQQFQVFIDLQNYELVNPDLLNDCFYFYLDSTDNIFKPIIKLKTSEEYVTFSNCPTGIPNFVTRNSRDIASTLLGRCNWYAAGYADNSKLPFQYCSKSITSRICNDANINSRFKFNRTEKGFWISFKLNDDRDTVEIDPVVNSIKKNGIYISQLYLEKCTEIENFVSYKNMLNCIQDNRNPCSIGTFGYNITEKLGNMTNVHDINNSRLFGRYVPNSNNQLNLLITGTEQGYLNNPIFFTMSCIIGPNTNKKVINLNNENILENKELKENYFPYYDISAITNSFEIDSFDIDENALKINSSLKVESGDFWYKDEKDNGIVMNFDGYLKLVKLKSYNENDFIGYKKGDLYKLEQKDNIITIYKQFGFNGLNYNTKSIIISNDDNDFSLYERRKYNGNSLYNNIIISNSLDVYSPRFITYIQNTKESDENYSFQIKNFGNKEKPYSYQQDMSMYYPVWNSNLNKQEAIMLYPLLLAYLNIIDNKIISANIQFSNKIEYEYDFEDNKYYYAKSFKVVRRSTSSNLILNSIDDIELTDRIFIPSVHLNRNIPTWTWARVNPNLNSNEPINIKDKFVRQVVKTKVIKSDSIYDYKYKLNNGVVDMVEYGKMYYYMENNKPIKIYAKLIDRPNNITINDFQFIKIDDNNSTITTEDDIFFIKKRELKLGLVIDNELIENDILKVDAICDNRIVSIKVDNNNIPSNLNLSNVNKPLVQISNIYISTNINTNKIRFDD